MKPALQTKPMKPKRENHLKKEIEEESSNLQIRKTNDYYKSVKIIYFTKIKNHNILHEEIIKGKKSDIDEYLNCLNKFDFIYELSQLK